ncbi:MAG: adenylate kinase [Mucinivorans sp.]
MLNILLFGPPGAGKGTQADLLKTRYDLLHLSTGEVIRQNIKNNTVLGAQAEAQMAGGGLASDELVCSIIGDYVAQNSSARGVLYDGFPRTLPQASRLDEILATEAQKVTAMVAMMIPDEVIVARILNRAKVSGRLDDQNIDTIRARIDAYNTQTAVVADYYKKQGKYFEIDGTGTIEDVNLQICKIIYQLIKG